MLQLVCASLCLLGAEAKPFSLESQYAGLLRSFGLNQRIARSAQSQYTGGGASAPSGYGAAAAPACRTEYKQECNTVNEQVSRTGIYFQKWIELKSSPFSNVTQ